MASGSWAGAVETGGGEEVAGRIEMMTVGMMRARQAVAMTTAVFTFAVAMRIAAPFEAASAPVAAWAAPVAVAVTEETRDAGMLLRPRVAAAEREEAESVGPSEARSLWRARSTRLRAAVSVVFRARAIWPNSWD